MQKTSLRFRLVDAALLFLTALPILCGIALRVLTHPYSEGINITGAAVFVSIPMPLQPFLVTESQVNSVLVLISIFFLCLYFTHGLFSACPLKRRLIAVWGVEKVEGLVKENMGEYFLGFVPFVLAILLLSAFSSLISLFGLFPPTSDINVTGGWAILVFILITHYKLKCGIVSYFKGLMEPVPILLPINIIGEVATPVSMAFRHYGNVLSGSVISTLLAAALGGISSAVLGHLPGFLADIPLFQIGLPAVFSVYFDVFSGLLQAFIFAMLTMMYVGGAFSIEEFLAKKAAKAEKKKKIKNRS